MDSQSPIGEQNLFWQQVLCTAALVFNVAAVYFAGRSSAFQRIGKVNKKEEREKSTSSQTGWEEQSSQIKELQKKNMDTSDEKLQKGVIPCGYVPSTAAELEVIQKYDSEQQIDSWLQWYLVNANWTVSIYTALSHAFALVGLWNIGYCKSATLVWTGITWFMSELGITAGSHRLYSHKSYKAAAPYRFVMMLMSSMANQGTIHHWVRDHRVHHKYSETKADPHNALRGFFFAHMGWILVKKDPRVIFAGNKLDLSDLKEFPEVVLQKRCNPVWNLFWCFLFPAIVAHYLWDESWSLGILVPGVLRYIVVLHCTFLVNSAAHLYGDRPYEDINPSENPLVALGASGEGWHNYHHAYPFDYAASELGVTQQYNPTKAIIDLCAYFGLVWDRKTAAKHWEARKARKNVVKEDLYGYPLFKIRKLD